jgi:hypothetical protein
VPLFLLAGCGKEKANTPERTTASKQRFSLTRLLSGQDTTALYGWDGQYSKAKLDMAPEPAFERAVASLQKLGFTIDKTDTKRQGAGARIRAVNSAKTEALVLLEAKGPATTDVKAKVGATGDRTASERVLEEIQSGAPAAPPPAKTQP